MSAFAQWLVVTVTLFAIWIIIALLFTSNNEPTVEIYTSKVVVTEASHGNTTPRAR